MKFDFSEEWCKKAADLEEGHNVAAGDPMKTTNEYVEEVLKGNVTRKEFEALKAAVAGLEASIAALWQQTSKARLDSMVFGPGDDDYGRDRDRLKLFEQAVQALNTKATQERTNGELLAQ